MAGPQTRRSSAAGAPHWPDASGAKGGQTWPASDLVSGSVSRKSRPRGGRERSSSSISDGPIRLPSLSSGSARLASPRPLEAARPAPPPWPDDWGQRLFLIVGWATKLSAWPAEGGRRSSARSPGPQRGRSRAEVDLFSRRAAARLKIPPPGPAARQAAAAQLRKATRKTSGRRLGAGRRKAPAEPSGSLAACARGAESPTRPIKRARPRARFVWQMFSLAQRRATSPGASLAPPPPVCLEHSLIARRRLGGAANFISSHLTRSPARSLGAPATSLRPACAQTSFVSSMPPPLVRRREKLSAPQIWPGGAESDQISITKPD